MINVCKNRMLNFILVNEEAKGEEDELPDDREGAGYREKIRRDNGNSIHALIGSNRSKTIRLPRNVKGRYLCSLIVGAPAVL